MSAGLVEIWLTYLFGANAAHQRALSPRLLKYHRDRSVIAKASVRGWAQCRRNCAADKPGFEKSTVCLFDRRVMRIFLRYSASYPSLTEILFSAKQSIQFGRTISSM